MNEQKSRHSDWEPLVKLSTSSDHISRSSREEGSLSYSLTAAEKFSFAAIGFTAFAGFQTTIQFPGRNYIDRAQDSFGNAQLLATTILLILGRKLDPIKSIFAGIWCLFGINLGVPIIATFAANSAIGFYAQLALIFVQQCMVALVLSSGFAFASVVGPQASAQLCRNASGCSILTCFALKSPIRAIALGALTVPLFFLQFVSFGVPIAGITAFIMSTIGCTLLSNYTLIIVMAVLPVLTSLACAYCTTSLQRKPYIAERVLHIRRYKDKQDVETSVHVEQGTSTFNVFRAAWAPITAIFLCMVVLFTIFPAFVGQIRDKPVIYGPVVLGLQTLGETIGRVFATMGLQLPRWSLVPLALLRFAFLPIFTAAYTVGMNHWLRSEMFLYSTMTLQGITFGVIIASSFVDAPSCVKSISDMQLAGILATCSCNYGLAAGTYFLKLMRLIGLMP